jgi:hypothetical protein
MAPKTLESVPPRSDVADTTGPKTVVDESEYAYDYRVNIELKDQFNNIFFIDDVKDDKKKAISLKDGSFTDITVAETKEINAVVNKKIDNLKRSEKQPTRYIYIYKDIYYIDNTVIQDLKSIFKNFIREIKESQPATGKSDRYDRYPDADTRKPIGKDLIKYLMSSTRELAQIHKIFTQKEYAEIIKQNIIFFSSGTLNTSRFKQINSPSYIDRIIQDNYKYIHNGTKTSNFDDDERMDTLMFSNVMYLLKNIYLKKQTILTNIQGEQYYIDEISYYDLPFVHMKKNDYADPRNIYIYLKVKTIPIIDIPKIKIHYLLDDLELSNFKSNAVTILKPGDIDKGFEKYNTMYIFDFFKYKNENDNINAFANSLKQEKRLEKIQEFYFNADIVNKYRKRYTVTEINKIRNDDKKKYTNMNENIKYMLREQFNLFDSKISLDNNFIDDTYIIYDISKNETSSKTDTRTDSFSETDSLKLKYHSIMTNKTINTYDNSSKERSIKTILNEHIARFAANYEKSNFFYEDRSDDNRLKTSIYNIIIIFRTYKGDSTKKKPSIARRFIGEECLTNAGTLDKLFSKIFYRTLGLPDKFLYDKFINMNTKNITAIDPRAVIPNIPVGADVKKGGKNYATKKYKTKNYKTKKYGNKNYKTKKKYKNNYKIKKYSAKKYKTKKYNKLL